MTRVCLVTLLALLVAPSVAGGSASPGGVTITSRALPIGGERMLASAHAPGRFDLVGLRWRGPGTVRFRTRALSGSWSSWQTPDDANPTWTDASDALQYRVRGHVSRLRAWYVWSPVERESPRRLADPDTR